MTSLQPGSHGRVRGYGSLPGHPGPRPLPLLLTPHLHSFVTPPSLFVCVCVRMFVFLICVSLCVLGSIYRSLTPLFVVQVTYCIIILSSSSYCYSFIFFHYSFVNHLILIILVTHCNFVLILLYPVIVILFFPFQNTQYF